MNRNNKVALSRFSQPVHDFCHCFFSPLFPQGTILIGRRECAGVGAGAAVVRQINLQIKGATYHLICKLICRLIFI